MLPDGTTCEGRKSKKNMQMLCSICIPPSKQKYVTTTTTPNLHQALAKRKKTEDDWKGDLT